MSHIAPIKDVEVCYEIVGTEHQQTLVQIPGLGSQMIRWDDTFYQLLIQKGFKSDPV